MFRLLVLCTGNICRSPVGEAILKAMLGSGEIQVRSAGLDAPIGLPFHKYSIQIAREMGYPLDPEGRSTRVLPNYIDDANLILVMDSDQKEIVNERFPKARGKTFLMGQWGEGQIADPIGKNEEYFRVILEKILACSNSWKSRIEELANEGEG